MFRKIIIMFCTLLFVIPVINTLNNESTVCASGYQDAKNVVGLNYSFIESMATAMSKIIYTQYNPSVEIPKGRWFGTRGEWRARDFIEENFSKWGISYDEERIEKTSEFFRLVNGDKIREILSVTNMNISYYYPPSGETKYIENFHMTPSWGLGGMLGLLVVSSNRFKRLAPFRRIVYYLYCNYGINTDVDYNDLKIYRRPRNLIENICEKLEYCADDFLNWLSGLISYGELLDRIMCAMESEYDFNFEDILLFQNKAEDLPWYNATIANCQNNFVLIGEDLLFNPDKDDLKPNKFFYSLPLLIEQWIYRAMYRGKYKGTLLYENQYNAKNETYNMHYYQYLNHPLMFINRSDGIGYDDKGVDLFNNRFDILLNYSLDQEWDPETDSYNIIGKIDGKSSDKTIIVDSLYDGYWNEGSCDSAIGMSVVLAIANYSRELERLGISPKYDMKFIGFGGEEAGIRGAYSYEKQHRKEENDVIVIDLNQLGYNQTFEPQTLYCIMNHPSIWNETIQAISSKSNYKQRTDQFTDFKTINTEVKKLGKKSGWTPPSDYYPFYMRDKRRISKTAYTFCFIKEDSRIGKTRWRQHHRTNGDYSKGDSMEIYNKTFVNISSELIWNVTKYFAYNPNCWFTDGSISTTIGDIDNDGYNDYVNISYTLDTIMPHERAKVFVRLWTDQRPSPYQRTKIYTLDRTGKQDYINITINNNWVRGNYRLNMYLFNSTGEINNEVLNPNNLPGRLILFMNDSYSESNTGFSGQNTNPSINTPSSQNANINAGVQTVYTVGGTDPEGDPVYYQMQYTNIATGSTEYTGWYGPYSSGVNQSIGKTWTIPGSYNVQVRSRDNTFAPNVYSNWSAPFNVTVNESIYYIAPEKHVVNTTLNVTGIAYGVNATSWEWMFDAQTRQVNNYTQSAEHSYSEKDTFTINLTVEDNQSTNYYFDHEIEIVPLLTSFIASDTTIQPNETITLNSTYIGEAAVDGSSWNWTFGDGNTSTTRNTTHSYTTPGTYNVTLTVKDVQNRSTNYTMKIYVDNDTPGFVSIAHTPVQYTTDDITTGFYPLKFSKDQNLSLFTDFYDTGTFVTNVSVNITFPDGTTTNITMNTNTTDPSDFTHLFTDTDQIGYYQYTIWATDAAGHINKTTNSNFFEVGHLFGTTNIQRYNTTIEDKILGTNYTIKEDGTADSITVYLKSNETPPAKAKCMIYQGTTLIGITEEKNVSTGEIFEWINFNFTGTKPTLTKNTKVILSCWSDKPSNISYDNTSTTTIGYNNISTYGTPANPITWEDGSPPPDEKYRTYSIYCSYSNLPEINNVSHSPSTVGFGYNVTITTDITDSSSLDIVAISMEYPNASRSWENNTMTNTINDTYEFIFDDTWLVGQYNYTIYATDVFGNKNSSSEYSFNVTGNATISICTIFDSYQNGTIINLTDPPAGNPPEIGYALNNSGNVLHIWNGHDNYYFNTSSGIQLTNHKDDYWTKNVLMLGYYNNDQWNLIYRTDELSGFNKEIDSDDETYVNATLWKDLTYNGYDFRLAIRYHLGINDTDLTIIPYIKNLDDDDIPYTLGFGWEIKDIQIAMTEEDDWIDINRTSYLLHTTGNSTIDQIYTDMDEASIYIREYMEDNTTEELYLLWNNSLNYKVQVKSRTGQYNAPVTLFIRIGTLDSGQEKKTKMQWHDGKIPASPVTYYFNSYNIFEAWVTTPSYMVDGSTSTSASATTDGDIQDCTGNTCPGTDIGIIESVEIRAYGKHTGAATDIVLTPQFGGTSDGDDHYFTTSTTAEWSSYYDITDDTNAPGTWDWDDVDDLDCDVRAYVTGEGGFSAYCYKVEVRVTFSQYVAPTITNPIPEDEDTGVTPPPELRVTVDDENGDTLTAYWYSNSSGSWVLFATNESIDTSGGAQTIKQTNSNFSNFSSTYYWSINVTDDRYWTNATYQFSTQGPNSTVNTITPYQQTSTPLTIIANGSASMDNVTLYYRYSQDNSTWIGPWWNNSWGYYKTCQINNPLDDYQMKIIVGNSTGGDVTCEGYAQSDFDDIRFLRTDNTTELPYWRENYTSDTQATFWVNNLYNDSIILMYYGNDDVTTSSNGTATFILFDDFNFDTDSNWYQHSYSQGYCYIRPIGQNLTAARLRWQARCNDVDSRNWAGTSYVGFTDINSSSCKTENYTTIRSSYNTDNGASETQPSFRFYTKQDGTGEDNGVYEKNITEGNTYLWDLRFSQSSSKVDVWDSTGTSKYSKTLSNYPPTTVAYQFIQHHDYHGDGSCSEEELTWYNATPSYLRSYCRGSHYGCDSHVEYRYYWLFIANYSASEPSWNSFGAQQTIGWKSWDNTSNPDTISPWSWIFDFPDGRGYYEFYSIGKANNVSENNPLTADTRCRYGNQSKIHNTGSYAILGYLYMDVQKYNTTSGNWTSVVTCLSDGSPRNLSSSGVNKTIAFDTLFNGLLNSSILWYYGNGTYRFYVAFMNPYDEVLVTNDETKLEATHQFTITFD